ncbi:MAG: hypothetical protein IPK82_33535 [Polyangiaceae bacterium]|nr:hypothetical protein [Polyangiaceae bacterium]
MSVAKKQTVGSQSVHKSLRAALWLVGAFAAVMFSLGCSEQGATPTCEDNVTEDGMQNDVENPCNAFGVCVVNGERADAVECCVDENGDPFTGGRLDACLFAFGEYEAP